MRNVSAFQPQGTTKAYYPLNGNSRDFSGNTNTGTDTSVTYPQGRFGQGARFNGTSSVITVADSASLVPPTTLTISCWFQLLTNTGTRQVLVSKWSDTSNQRSWFLNATPTSLELFTSDSGADPTVASVSYSGTFRLGTWYHGLVTYSSGSIIIYVNGLRVASGTGRSSLFASTSSLRMGARNSTNTEFLSGLLDEVIIENRVWTAAEVSTYYRKSVLNHKQKSFAQMVFTYTSELLKGAYTLTGKEISVFKNYVVQLLKGAYTLTGREITNSRGYIAQLLKGTFTLAGKVLRVPITWVNSTKNSASWTDATKNSSTWTNQDRS